MATLRGTPTVRRSLSPKRKAASKSPVRKRVLDSRPRYSLPALPSKIPLVGLVPTTSTASTEVGSGDDWSQYSGEEKSEVYCLQRLKEYCKLFQMPASDPLIFRYACFYDWDYEETRKALKKDFTIPNPYLNIEMDDAMVKQFHKAIMFPLPKMRTKKGKSQVIYVRPVRYQRSPEAFDGLLKQLCFLLNDLSRSAQQCRHGVSFLVNLKGFSRRNADMENSTRLVQLIQNNHHYLVPTKIEMILFVDTTSMSSKMWQSIHPMLLPNQLDKIHFIKHDELYGFLMPSFEKYLPEDLQEGWKNTTDLVDGYVERKLKAAKEPKEQ